jgi:hypothetical protein
LIQQDTAASGDALRQARPLPRADDGGGRAGGDDDDPELGDELQALAATAKAAPTTSQRCGLRFIDLSPP